MVGKNKHLVEGHPINRIKKIIQNYFSQFSPKFEFVDDQNPVVTVEDNFDKLLFPKEHVGRSPNDTYYADKNHVLRTHTTCYQSEFISSGKKCYLVTGDVYRRFASSFYFFGQLQS